MSDLYRVITVKANTDHILSQYVEGDEQMFVTGDKGSWWLAEDFFLIQGEVEFEVKC